MKSKNNVGFTLIELIVTIAIISVLSGIILFTVSQYINKGKDSNISGNLAILIPAGEVWYNSYPNKYTGFCGSSSVTNALSQMPNNPSGICDKGVNNPEGVCCKATDQAWAACAVKFTVPPAMAFCVDSRGMKKEIPSASCTSALTQCPP